MMQEQYIISIDQSNQGTKAMLFDHEGIMLGRSDLPHRQIVNESGWVSHDPEEIYHNTIRVVQDLLEKSGIEKEKIAGVGISNQRETSLAWDSVTGRPEADAVVWQCARASAVCEQASVKGAAELIRNRTGLELSPYFPASKYAWFLENDTGTRDKADRGGLRLGTMDTWLIYKLTKGRSFKTDFSNASRTQLFNIFTMQWDENICGIFHIPAECLAEVCDSDSCFGMTDFEGVLPHEVPIHSVLGDSHGALFGQGCLTPGMMKATYGTGSSIMMNIGEKPVLSTHGVVTSLAWKMNGKVNYVLEGNINYTGAVISWLKDEAELISTPGETQGLCYEAEQDDSLYFVPAFTGLGAPYWNSQAKGSLSGITRTTKRAEIVRACTECIAYQIMDVIEAMSKDAEIEVTELRVDGGPTRNEYLMQFQSDILDAGIQVPDAEELSGIGAAYAAGIALGLYTEAVFTRLERRKYEPDMERDRREQKISGWKAAVEKVL